MPCARMNFTFTSYPSLGIPSGLRPFDFSTKILACTSPPYRGEYWYTTVTMWWDSTETSCHPMADGQVHVFWREMTVQLAMGSQSVRISLQHYVLVLLFHIHVLSTDYPLHSPVSHSICLCHVYVCHHILKHALPFIIWSWDCMYSVAWVP
jgi:hypothetical protein